jgi:hypothetical protein
MTKPKTFQATENDLPPIFQAPRINPIQNARLRILQAAREVDLQLWEDELVRFAILLTVIQQEE